MKKNIFIAALFFLTNCTFNFSCKKNNDAKATTVEYLISPMSNSIIEITYNDNTGTPVQTVNLSDFPNGSKTISVSKKPFDANISVKVSNTTNATITFNLEIQVNGQMKKVVGVSAPPNGNVTYSADYTVQ